MANTGSEYIVVTKGMDEDMSRCDTDGCHGTDMAARLARKPAAMAELSGDESGNAQCLRNETIGDEPRVGSGNGGLELESTRDGDGGGGEGDGEEEEEEGEQVGGHEQDGCRAEKVALTKEGEVPEGESVPEAVRESRRAASAVGGGGGGGGKEVSSSPFHNVLESKIAQLENLSTEENPSDDEARQRAKLRRKQGREFKTLAESTDCAAEEKIRALQAKFMQQMNETKQLERELLALRRKCELLKKEKDAVSVDLTKGNSMKQKLESLCRELQRQNKIVMEDSKNLAMEEQQKRQDLSTRFQTTIQDITVKLEEHAEERMRQIKENETLRDKLKHFTQQYEIREEHFQHQLRTKGLELQLMQAKLNQQTELTNQEAEKVKSLKDNVNSLQKAEADLRGQVSMYGNKFEQFQETLTKSNEVFATFKQEMGKMSKTIKKLEKENSSLKMKCDKSDVTMIQLLEERETLKKQADTLRIQKEKLEGLCRSLQSERKIAMAAISQESHAKPEAVLQPVLPSSTPSTTEGA